VAKRILIIFVLMAAFGGYFLHSERQDAENELSPQILQIPSTRMAVVYTKGDPTIVAQQALQSLYGSVFQLQGELAKKGVQFPMGAPRARWPNTVEAPREEWIGIWGLPIPEEAESIPQANPDVEVKVEIWEYGTVAQILHVGPYETEPGTIKILMDFVAESGYEVSGAHEEEYLTMPGADPQKTLIRYLVKKK
jgi:hypothetical protein